LNRRPGGNENKMLKEKRSVHQWNICRRLVIVKVLGVFPLVNLLDTPFTFATFFFGKSVADLYNERSSTAFAMLSKFNCAR